MGVYSDGSYGIPAGLIYSFPVTCDKGEWSIVKGKLIDFLYLIKLTRDLSTLCLGSAHRYNGFQYQPYKVFTPSDYVRRNKYDRLAPNHKYYWVNSYFIPHKHPYKKYQYVENNINIDYAMTIINGCIG